MLHSGTPGETSQQQDRNRKVISEKEKKGNKAISVIFILSQDANILFQVASVFLRTMCLKKVNLQVPSWFSGLDSSLAARQAFAHIFSSMGTSPLHFIHRGIVQAIRF